mgnify:CR=1 FL=1
MKVVLNKCFGGFSISIEAAEFMAARGNKLAQAELEDYKLEKHWYGYGLLDSKKYPNFGTNGYDRTDPDLIAAVEALGDKASGSCARLRIVEIPDGINWHIDEYDGTERIDEWHQSWG